MARRRVGALAQNKKIEAIKLYRQATGAGLKDAKDVVDAIAADPAFRPAQGEQVLPSAGLTDAKVSEISTAIASGRKIQAIKQYREATGASLIDAKRAVEAMQAGLPIPAPGSAPASSPVPFVAFVVVLVVVVGLLVLVPKLVHAVAH